MDQIADCTSVDEMTSVQIFERLLTEELFTNIADSPLKDEIIDTLAEACDEEQDFEDWFFSAWFECLVDLYGAEYMFSKFDVEVKPEQPTEPADEIEETPKAMTYEGEDELITTIDWHEDMVLVLPGNDESTLKVTWDRLERTLTVLGMVQHPVLKKTSIFSVQLPEGEYSPKLHIDKGVATVDLLPLPRFLTLERV